MKILVFGAGVLGSLYAGCLAANGENVTILARGQRFIEIQQNGIMLENFNSGARVEIPVRVIEQLSPEEAFDLAIVLVRKNQLASVLPSLAANRHIPSILFMVNSAEGPEKLVEALGRERVLLGFPGAGGERAGALVRYHVVSRGTQPTTLGELDGTTTPRLRQILDMLSSAGFPVAACNNMPAWLKTHVALVSPIANALYLAGGDNYRLAKTQDGVILMVRAIREGLDVLRALNVPITPIHFNVLRWVPEVILVKIMQRVLSTSRAELVMARHANSARDEMQQLATEFMTLARSSNVSTPALDQLALYIDSTVPTVPEGMAKLEMDWRGFWISAGVFAAVVTTAAWLLFGKRRKE
jgi:2-dehydropantoate 2-reductase